MVDNEKHYCVIGCGVVAIVIGMGFHVYTGNVLWWFGGMTALYPLAMVQMLINGTPVRWWEAALGTLIVGTGLALSIVHDHVGYWCISFTVSTLILSHFFNRQHTQQVTAPICDEEDRSG